LSSKVDRSPSRRVLAGLLLGGVLFLAVGTAAASRNQPGPAATSSVASSTAGDETVYDVRVRGPRPGPPPASTAQRQLLRRLGPSGTLQRDSVRGGVRLLAERDGFLTEPSGAPPGRVAIGYVRRRAEAFGLESSDLASLELTRRYTSESGATHLQWEQTFEGIPAFDEGLRANVSADGRLINVGGSPRRDLAVRSTEPRLGPGEALRAAAGDVRSAVPLGHAGPNSGPRQTTRFARGHRASLVLFGGAEQVRLSWRVLLRADSQHVYDAVIDAASGETLYRRNLVRHATGLAFDNYPGAPVGGTQVSRVFPEAGEDPWVTSSTRLFGDNAHVYSDEQDRIDGGPDPNPLPGDEIPPSAPGAWNHLHDARAASSPGQDCPPTPGCSWNNFDFSPPNFSWRVNREQAGTQLFYFVNRFHDHLRDASGIAFDDASGNFEAADRVEAQVDDGGATDDGNFDDFPDCAHVNNAGVIPLPDGEPLLMQVYLWSSACDGSTVYDVNAADDALIVYHEYTHGLTNRLVTDADGFGALNGPQPGALDEGLADWYAVDFLNASGFEPDSPAPGELLAGEYLNDRLRTQPFDCPVGASAPACPGRGQAGPGGYTYGDFGKILGTPEVHADGEIWVETLWDLRRALVDAHGVAAGIDRTRALVTDGMRLSPANPTFLDMRNAILQADVNRGFGDRDRIWAAFAARGMGLNASTTGPSDTRPVEDFTVPPQDSASDAIAPIISGFSMTRARFRVGLARTPRLAQLRRSRPGSAFLFRLSEPATVTIAIQRGLPGRRVGRSCRRPAPRLRFRSRCTRYRLKGTLTRRDRPGGGNRVRFSGRIGLRPLRPGPHRATITATDAAGNASRSMRTRFTIVRK
jgi:extracellular elastinolytic metalloproteinase